MCRGNTSALRCAGASGLRIMLSARNKNAANKTPSRGAASGPKSGNTFWVHETFARHKKCYVHIRRTYTHSLFPNGRPLHSGRARFYACSLLSESAGRLRLFQSVAVGALRRSYATLRKPMKWHGWIQTHPARIELANFSVRG